MRALSALRSLPNLVSISRLALAAAFVIVAQPEVRIVLVIAALATDYLDGWIARHLGSTTRMGALLDPFADRLFVLVVVSVLLFDGALTTLGYFVMIFRDIMTAIGFLTARIMPSLRGVQFQARFPGKLVTVLQLATFIAVLVSPSSASPMLLVVAATSLWAVVDYIWFLHKARAR